jgi:LuxR family transcriptional regulator, maltose regulon positive regulatory protein
MTHEGASMVDRVASGWEALARGDWSSARARFEQALGTSETPEALEGLGWAAYCLDNGPLTLDARERAYRLYFARGDDAAAGRVASWLAVDFLEFRGERAVASGWLQRAHRLLDDAERGPGHGWLAIHEASLGLEQDPVASRRRAAEAAAVGREFGVLELEMLGLAMQGRALVSEGHPDEGMRLLDEATAVALAGESKTLVCAAWACCELIGACEQVRDYERAGQWCKRVGDFCERYGIALLLGMCRAQYGGVLTWQGRWVEAEHELTAAAEGLSPRPALVDAALVRLGELRRRQGRFDEAEELFARCEGHPRAVLGRAAAALDNGCPEDAADLADRFLRRFADPTRMERCAGLEIAVGANVQLGCRERAREALGQLRQIAATAGTRPLQAAVITCEGKMAAGVGDHDGARRAFEDSLDLHAAIGAPFDAAEVRLELAVTLMALGRDEAARRESETALAAFRELGAATGVARTEAMLSRARSLPPPSTADEGPLTELSKRECEVLALIAEGLTNHEIAERLILSRHTVNRHVANILRKLSVPSRAAAASLAARHGVAE